MALVIFTRCPGGLDTYLPMIYSYEMKPVNFGVGGAGNNKI